MTEKIPLREIKDEKIPLREIGSRKKKNDLQKSGFNLYVEGQYESRIGEWKHHWDLEKYDTR